MRTILTRQAKGAIILFLYILALLLVIANLTSCTVSKGPHVICKPIKK